MEIQLLEGIEKCPGCRGKHSPHCEFELILQEKEQCEYRINKKCTNRSSVLFEEECNDKDHDYCFHPECEDLL